MTLPSPPLALGTAQPMWLGKPNAMQQLRMADSPYQSIATRSEATHQLISGGVAVTRIAKTKRSWVLPFSGMTEDTANLLVGFYSGAMGLGPYIFVDPAWRNKLSPNVSSMGAVLQAIDGWAPSSGSGTLAWDGTDAAPFVESDVMTWTGAGNGSKIVSGSWSGATIVPRTSEAPVYIPSFSIGGSIYLRTASSTANMSLQCIAVTAGGSSSSGAATTATINSSGWTRFVNFAPTANTTMQYVVLQVQCNTASAPVIWASCADIQYGPTSVAGMGAWVLGLGSPRVVLPGSQSGGFISTTRLLPYRDQGISLAEV